ncbi:Protein tssc1 [Cichlidogyrus casuarinus]|uniref:Protein tssc1 n=1 Tax=Cichlidogyrus casuarinus TaxID=1844966 RepID=A0ABD2Q9D6_9PLAT
MDFSANRDNLLVTGSDAGLVSLWDLRHAIKPVAEQPSVKEFNPTTATFSQWFVKLQDPALMFRSSSHQHWVWSVKFHPTRDELVLSSGGDNRICLHNFNLPDPNQDDVASEAKHPLKDGVVAISENNHSDSVYACDWSQVDPWTFASVSYDGHVFITTVPEQIKLVSLLQDDISLLDEPEEERIVEQEKDSD